MISREPLSTKTRDQLIILLVVLGVYYQVNYMSGLNLDDHSFISRLETHSGVLNWVSWFVSQESVRYFRPLLELISALDYNLWGFQYTGYHLTNLLAHLINSLLVYSITFKLLERHPYGHRLALFSALFFGIHPLTCESVAWISGRSDLFGTLFPLISFRMYLIKHRSKFFFVPFFLLLGLFCKENALSLIPIILLSNVLMGYYKKKEIKDIAVSTCLWMLLVAIPLMVYLYLRTGKGVDLSYDFVNLQEGVRQNHYSKPGLSILKVIATAGFYLKKLFIVFPLNFAISKINIELYVSVFILFVGVNIFWGIKKYYDLNLWSMLIVSSFAPSLLVGLGGISWMPYAERYVYLSIPVLGVAVSVWLSCHVLDVKWTSIILFLLLSFMGATTVYRLQVWKSSELLFADTLRKNPNNGKVLYKYGKTLGEEKGRPYFEKAVDVASNGDWKDLSCMELASYYAKENDRTIVMKYIDQALEINNKADIYIWAAEILSTLKPQTQKEHLSITDMQITFYNRAYEKKPSPFLLYQLIKLNRRIGDTENSQKYFMKLMKRYPQSEYAGYMRRKDTLKNYKINE